MRRRLLALVLLLAVPAALVAAKKSSYVPTTSTQSFVFYATNWGPQVANSCMSHSFEQAAQGCATVPALSNRNAIPIAGATVTRISCLWAVKPGNIQVGDTVTVGVRWRDFGGSNIDGSNVLSMDMTSIGQAEPVSAAIFETDPAGDSAVSLLVTTTVDNAPAMTASGDLICTLEMEKEI